MEHKVIHWVNTDCYYYYYHCYTLGIHLRAVRGLLGHPSSGTQWGNRLQEGFWMMLACSKLPPPVQGAGGALCRRTRLSGNSHPSRDPLARRSYTGWAPQLRAGCRSQTFPQVNWPGAAAALGLPTPANTHLRLGTGRKDLKAGESTVSGKGPDPGHRTRSWPCREQPGSARWLSQPLTTARVGVPIVTRVGVQHHN